MYNNIQNEKKKEEIYEKSLNQLKNGRNSVRM